MRASLKIGMAALLWTAFIASPLVSSAARSGSDEAGASLLSAEQGEMLVDFALQAGAHLHSKPDCSHLVHTLYSQAGLNYPYQPSRALYLGVEDFVRVRNPQPGDLIVWRGHVGIVVSPEDKTFFSSVRSGIITESWTTDHWRARGHARFFRYRVGLDSNPALLASLNRDQDRETPALAGQGGDDGDAADSEATRSSSVDAVTAGTGSSDSAIDMAAQQPAAGPGENRSKSVVVVMHQHKKPGKQEVAAAFLQANSSTARTLSTGAAPARSLSGDRPLSIFTRVEVSRIRIKHDSGSVTLKLTEVIALEQGRTLPAKNIERELTLSRGDVDGTAAWIISDPRGRVYIPQSQALAVFQHQAELLLHRSPDSTAARTAVKVLDLLYDQQPANSQRASLK